MQSDKISLIADACGTNVKLAIIRNGNFEREYQSRFQAMESFAQSLSEICAASGISVREISEIFLCVGPGSILGTRTASAVLSTIAKTTNAKIFTWDILEAGVYALANRNVKQPFCLLAPSRKGFANCAAFADGKLLSETELDLSDAAQAQSVLQNSFLLNQKKNPEAFLAKFENVDFTMGEIWKVLTAHCKLAKQSNTPPNAKSLSERIYVKWKAPALI